MQSEGAGERKGSTSDRSMVGLVGVFPSLPPTATRVGLQKKEKRARQDGDKDGDASVILACMRHRVGDEQTDGMTSPGGDVIVHGENLWWFPYWGDAHRPNRKARVDRKREAGSRMGYRGLYGAHGRRRWGREKNANSFLFYVCSSSARWWRRQRWRVFLLGGLCGASGIYGGCLFEQGRGIRAEKNAGSGKTNGGNVFSLAPCGGWEKKEWRGFFSFFSVLFLRVSSSSSSSCTCIGRRRRG